MNIRLMCGVVLFLVVVRAEAVPGESDVFQQAQAALEAQSYERSFELFQEASKDDPNGLADFSLGMFYHVPWGRDVDPVQACHYFEKAAHKGVPYAQHLLGECLDQGLHVKQDFAAALHWYEQATAAGHYISACNQAWLYMGGRGVEKDPQKALALCNSAAGVSPGALIELGRLLTEGDEQVRDYPQAAVSFEQALDRGVVEGGYYLGRMIEQGLVVNEKGRTARDFYEVAAAAGFENAYYPTAKLYFNAPFEPGTEALSAHDLAKAYMWLSATQKRSKDKQALKETGRMLEQVLNVMPESWRSDLDERVTAHLKM